MIKSILSGLGRTFLFVKDPTWQDTLNNLHAKLEIEKPGYDFWKYFELNHDYLDLMNELKAEYKVNMFTSGIIQTQKELYSTLLPTFEQIFNENSIGFRKYEKDSYLEIAKRLKLEPSEILFIDDDGRCIGAAKLAGLITYQMHGFEKLKEDLKDILK